MAEKAAAKLTLSDVKNHLYELCYWLKHAKMVMIDKAVKIITRTSGKMM